MTDKTQGKGGPIIVAALAVCGAPAYVLAGFFGAGSVAMVSAMVSLFTFISIIGGSLRADLKVSAVVAPLIFIGATIPRLASERSVVAGAVIVCVFMLVVVLLPLQDERLGNARMGAGMSVIFSFAMSLPGTFEAAHFVAAILVGVLVPIPVRIMLGIHDPDKDTRERLASLLDSDEPDVEAALHAWLLSGCKRWQAQVLSAACSSRAGAHMLRLLNRSAPDSQIDKLAESYRSAAAQVAKQVRAKRPDADQALDLPDADLAGEEGRMARQAADGLRKAHEAAVNRPPGVTPRPPRESLRAIVGKPLLRERQVQIRHAVRTFIGMCIMVSLTAWLLPQGSSLTASALLCTFAILQASWHDSLAKAKARIIGVSAGMVAAVALTTLLPQEALLPIAFGSMFLGMWFMLSKPTVAYFFMALMSVGIAVGARGNDPDVYIVQYFVVVAAAVIVGVFGGFALVRPAPHPSLAQSVETAWESVFRVLEALRDNGDRPVVLTGAFAEHSAAIRELRAEHAGKETGTAAHDDVEAFARACTDLVLYGIDGALSDRDDLERMTTCVRQGISGGSPDAPLEEEPGAFRLIAHARQLGASLCSDT